MRPRPRHCRNPLCAGVTGGRFCPRCGMDLGRGASQIRSVAVLVPIVIAVMLLAALSMSASRPTAMPAHVSPAVQTMSAQTQSSSTSAKPFVRWQTMSGTNPNTGGLSAVTDNLPGTLALMTSEEGRLAAVRSFVARLSGRPLSMGDLLSALCFFTSEPQRVEAVRLLASRLRSDEANADASGPLAFFTSDEGRAAALEAIRGGK